MDSLTSAILVVSDTAFADPTTDKSAKILADTLKEDSNGTWTIEKTVIVPDDNTAIQREILNLTDGMNPVSLVLTTGGTGFAVKDVTPEAVSPFIQKPAPGLVHAMLSASLQVTPFASMSRPVAGIRNKTVIVTLPGSPKGAKENLQSVLKLLPHACLQASGEDSRKAHAGGVKQLEMEAGIRSHSDQNAGHAHQHKHIHDHHHGHHTIPKAHTKPEDRPVSNDPRAGPTQRHRHSPYPMISVQQATEIVLQRTPSPATIMAPVGSELTGTILANDVQADQEVPAFEASIVDGYATSTLSKGTFKVASVSHASPGEPAPLGENEVARITTGAPLPPGAKAVVMVEDTVVESTTTDGSEEVTVKVLTDEIQPGENIRAPGSDVKKGDIILRKGTAVTAIGGEIGLLASVGIAEVEVYSKCSVGVLSTGDELVEHDLSSPLRLGQVRDTNRPALLAAIRAWGYSAIDLGIAKDKPETLESTLRSAFRRCEVIVTTGGVSMGELDLLKPTIERSLGGTIHFGRLAMKPGKPTTFATVPFKSIDGDRSVERLIFSLPGNPASALVTLHLFVLPCLEKAKGRTGAEVGMPRCRVMMDEDVRCDAKREEYCRAIITAGMDGALHALTTGGQRSSRVGSLMNANGLLVLPAKDGLVRKGEQVDALMMGQIVGM